mmetsp:Transcript_7170/g.10665  ORF Transcript_7170/g.10665 Transcript_7170/m.10665 type:complete len:223 (+) Transcript_7170:73-741(+)
MQRLAFLLLGCLSMAKAGSNQTMDMYVFAYSWQPEFCYDKTNYYGCEHPEDFWGKYFTVHGLWPQYSSGGYPSYCTDEAFDPAVPEEIGMDDMTTYWPDTEYAESDPNYDEFWTHEWTKHGTCSNLSQYDYFSATIALIKKFGTPADYTAAVGSTISASTLRDDFGGPSYASLQCSGGNYVNGVFTCWGVDEAYMPTVQIECPEDVQGEDTCTSETLEVASF